MTDIAHAWFIKRKIQNALAKTSENRKNPENAIADVLKNTISNYIILRVKNCLELKGPPSSKGGIQSRLNSLLCNTFYSE